MSIKAKVIAKTTINNEPAEVGQTVVVDEITFRNLQAKGRLEAIETVAEVVEVADQADQAAPESKKSKGKK